MTIKEILNKLIGSIFPIGETNTDDKRYKNLEKYCDLLNEMSFELMDVVRYNKDHYEGSRIKAGEKSFKVLKMLKEDLEDFIENI